MGRLHLASEPSRAGGPLVTLFLLGCSYRAPRAAGPEVAAAALVFTHVNVIDVVVGQVVRDQTVIIRGNRLAAMGAADQVAVPRTAQVVEATDCYLMPGLWDMHSHIGVRVPAEEQSAVMRAAHVLLLANGVTGIRDAGTPVPLDSLLAWRREILAGQRVGPPRQLLAGRSLEGGKLPADATHALEVPTLAAVRRAVDSLLAAGADYIKVHDFEQPLHDSVVAELRQRGILFGGHMGTVDTGARFLDHLSYYNPTEADQLQGNCSDATAALARCRPVAERMRRNDMWFAASPLAGGGHLGLARAWSRLSPAQQAQQRESSKHDQAGIDPSLKAQSPAEWSATRDSFSEDPRYSLSVLERAGVPLLAATDFPMSHGTHLVTGVILHDGLAMLVQRGLTPLAALQAATLNPAKALHATDSLGTVGPGKLADLVLLDGDPLADIRHTLAIRGVVANGRYFDRAALDSLLAGIDYDLLVHRHSPP